MVGTLFSSWFSKLFHLALESWFLCAVKESRLAKFLLTIAEVLSSKEASWWTTRKRRTISSLILLLDSKFLTTWIVETPDFFNISNMSSATFWWQCKMSTLQFWEFQSFSKVTTQQLKLFSSMKSDRVVHNVVPQQRLAFFSGTSLQMVTDCLRLVDCSRVYIEFRNYEDVLAMTLSSWVGKGLNGSTQTTCINIFHNQWATTAALVLQF